MKGKWMHSVHKRLATHLSCTSSPDVTKEVYRCRPWDLYHSTKRNKIPGMFPHFVLPSCLLPNGYISSQTYNGKPILLYRDSESGTVKAFLNKCRHRGAQLVGAHTTVKLKSRAIVCPYHAWTYDIRDGSLKRIPGEAEAFSCVKKEDHGLIPLSCKEVAGGIWVYGDAMKEVEDFSEHKQVHIEIEELLDLSAESFSMGRMVGTKEWEIDANWQISVETFLESYHVPSLHKNTLNIVTQANNKTVPMVTDHLDGCDIRMTVPLQNFDATLYEENAKSFVEQFLSSTTTTYFLFPNVSITLTKRFAFFMSIAPRHDDVSKSKISAWAITYNDHEEQMNLCQRDLEGVVNGVEEDWDCVEKIFKNLSKDQISIYGSYEGNNIKFLNDVKNIATHFVNT
ncbi:hypothetical protein CTEN210_16187 [Chaetoceros tenuissimus]|uniref:Choline monooxygenase, chloroplastic n=1 Tax=Chaetoceros tenuissimus TaxID=426638 RepID=A0AAD3D8A9_9STRA|nr:hypothetical protein CTEN210_16187 [Chaetoceros tenuissimus]